MKSRWITHQGKNLFYADYSGFRKDTDGLIAEVDAADEAIMKEPKDSVLLLVDVNDSVGTTTGVNYLKMSSARTKDYIHKAAVVGVSGVRLVLMEAIIRFSGQDIMPFDDVEKAKAWLVSAG